MRIAMTNRRVHWLACARLLLLLHSIPLNSSLRSSCCVVAVPSLQVHHAVHQRCERQERRGDQSEGAHALVQPHPRRVSANRSWTKHPAPPVGRSLILLSFASPHPPTPCPSAASVTPRPSTTTTRVASANTWFGSWHTHTPLRLQLSSPPAYMHAWVLVLTLCIYVCARICL